VRDSDRFAVDNDIGGIELALSEIAFGPVEYARAAVSPPQFDGKMRHLLLRKQRMGKAELDAGDCGQLAFALAFNPDNATVTAAAAPTPQPAGASDSSATAAAAAAAVVVQAAPVVAAPAPASAKGRGADDAASEQEEVPSPVAKKDESAYAQGRPYQQPKDLGTRGQLVVHIVGGAGLLSADSNGLSDPYVKVRLPKLGGGEHKKETKVIKKTLAPVWDQRFYFPGKLADFVGQTLELKLRDHDMGPDPDDDIGEVEVSLGRLRSESRLEFDRMDLKPPAFEGSRHRLGLRSKSKKNLAANFGECGTLTFTVSFE
jgi:hypothetical protein